MISEDILIKQCKKGKSSAQDALYRKYAGNMLGVCMRYTSCKEEAEDVLQEGFIKVFTKIKSFNNENIGSFGGWIRRIMVNTALNYYRDNLKHKHFIDVTEIEENYHHDDHEQEDGYPVSKEKIMEIVQSLPAGYKMVFNLYVFEKYSHQNIADEMGITASTSKSQLSKARAYIRKKVLEQQKKNVISKAI